MNIEHGGEHSEHGLTPDKRKTQHFVHLKDFQHNTVLGWVIEQDEVEGVSVEWEKKIRVFTFTYESLQSLFHHDFQALGLSKPNEKTKIFSRIYSYDEATEILHKLASLCDQEILFRQAEDPMKPQHVGHLFRLNIRPEELSQAIGLICFSNIPEDVESFTFWGIVQPTLHYPQAFSKLFVPIKYPNLYKRFRSFL